MHTAGSASKQAPRPSLILLDLSLPRKHGQAVLEEIRSDPALKTIPVVVLTTSTEEQDILQAYNARGNAYVAKLLDLKQFFEAVPASIVSGSTLPHSLPIGHRIRKRLVQRIGGVVLYSRSTPASKDQHRTGNVRLEGAVQDLLTIHLPGLAGRRLRLDSPRH